MYYCLLYIYVFYTVETLDKKQIRVIIFIRVQNGS